MAHINIAVFASCPLDLIQVNLHWDNRNSIQATENALMCQMTNDCAYVCEYETFTVLYCISTTTKMKTATQFAFQYSMCTLVTSATVRNTSRYKNSQCITAITLERETKT